MGAAPLERERAKGRAPTRKEEGARRHFDKVQAYATISSGGTISSMPSRPPTINRDLFRDRADAGRRLAVRVLERQLARPVVLALPRGGVPVAVEVARRLKAPLDLVLVRKLGAPADPELAVGAVSGTPDDPQIVRHTDTLRLLGVPDGWIERAAARELVEIERRRRLYLGDRPPVDIKGRSVVLIDDGIATGATVSLALQLLRRQRPLRILLATPVAPPSALATLKPLCDDIVTLIETEDFHGVGQFYRDFHQVSDAEVMALMKGGD